MSITSALSNALSGLTVTGRAADVVSANIANATTEGYGVRRLGTASNILAGQGGGVRATGVDRQSDPQVIGARRGADAALAGTTLRADFARQMETALGTPDQPGSLAARLNGLEASLVAAANRPESPARLAAVLDAAKGITTKLADISREVQEARLTADRAIARETGLLNDTLAALQEVNTQLFTTRGGGRDQSGLLDRQQVLVDQIAGLVPIRELRDGAGRVSLYSADGVTLLDGRATVFEFDPVTIMTPDLVTGGGLSGLRMDGRPVPLEGAFPVLQGGSLAALFALRDDLAVEAQASLDAVAQDLAERFEDPALDVTRAAGAPGLFTDAGAPVAAAADPGLAGRLRINALADPTQGGAIWRLRDGLGAMVEGPTGRADLLQDMASALQAVRPTTSGALSGGVRSMAMLAADMLSLTAQARQAGERDQAEAATRQGSLRAAELRGGVDTDREMQELLIIEQSFAANARMVQAVEEMIDTLLRI